jgi:peptidoglycan-associated lipoprotein
MMGMRQAIRLLVAASVCLLLIGGCGKKDVDMKPEGNLLGGAADQSGQPDAGTFTSGELESLEKTGVNPLLPDTTSDEYKAVYGRSTAPLYPVFFSFDSSVIEPNQYDNLNSSGAHLLVNLQARLVVEGNCDERGTADYNMALGELRALNVKKYLANLGVAESRIKTISYGSERPLYPGHDEESWAMNRRVDLVMP